MPPCAPTYLTGADAPQCYNLSRWGIRHPARAALVYLARRRTMATNAQSVPVLGVSREATVPNLTRRFEGWLATDAKVRKQLRSLEHQLDGS